MGKDNGRRVEGISWVQHLDGNQPSSIPKRLLVSSLRYAPVADRTSQDRFHEVIRYIHFVDNDTLVPRGEEGYDRLGKVRPVIDHLSTKFTEVYQPHRDIAVDEAMIKFQDRSSLKQYMPLKPTKRGIKVWKTVQMGTFLDLRCTLAKWRTPLKSCQNPHLGLQRQIPPCLL